LYLLDPDSSRMGGYLYEHDDYEGDGLIVTSDISDLDDVMGCGGDWDNCASSLQVRPPR